MSCLLRSSTTIYHETHEKLMTEYKFNDCPVYCIPCIRTVLYNDYPVRLLCGRTALYEDCPIARLPSIMTALYTEYPVLCVITTLCTDYIRITL